MRGHFSIARGGSRMEGMFGDPYYGGNKNFAGWDLIRYPGPRLATSADDQKMGVAHQAVSPLRLRKREPWPLI